jgi:hypothetical protein
MPNWMYSRGTWQEIEPPHSPVTDEESFEIYMQHHGYAQETVIGESTSLQVQVWARQPGEPWPLALVLTTADYLYPVWIPNLPSLIMGLREMLPIVRHELAIDREVEALRVRGGWASS